jgi:iron complex transport system substrate-binding protein
VFVLRRALYQGLIVILMLLLFLLSATSSVWAAFPVSLTDDLGYQVTLASKPTRIISMAPSNTEILFAIGAADQVIAVDSDSDYPAAAKGKASVGSALGASVERIVAFNPDLVLLWDASAGELRNQLARLGITVAVFSPQALADVYETITKIGMLTGAEQGANALVNRMKQQADQVRNTVAKATTRPLVLYEVWYDPLYTAGPGSLMDELINLAGGRNLAADAPGAWPAISMETAVTRNPDVILTPFSPSESITGRQAALWASVNAVKNKRIVQIDQNIVSRPGPRITEALELIAKALHPHLF